MSDAQIQSDVQALAGRLLHRGSNTENERTAAEYIRERFLQYTPDTETDDFYSIENPWLLFGSYYAEFTVVCLIAVWWPRLALCYGAVVLLAYLAEFTGHRLLGRLLPHFETQNVVARFLAPRPARLLIVMAHYDTGKSGPLEFPWVMPRLRALHFAIVACMAAVLLTCAAEALGLSAGASFRYDLLIRWCAAACLLATAGAVIYNAFAGEYARGPNDNASGVAALLALAERFAREPVQDADVCLVATGSHKAWMNGARRFVTLHKTDRAATAYINLDAVGAGHLRYTVGEGMLHVCPCSKDLVDAAGAVAAQYDAVPMRLHAACSDALIPLTRGCHAITITSVDPQPDRKDSLANLDSASIRRAADFAEALVRRIAPPLRTP